MEYLTIRDRLTALMAVMREPSYPLAQEHKNEMNMAQKRKRDSRLQGERFDCFTAAVKAARDRRINTVFYGRT